jgi:hypothetical protein
MERRNDRSKNGTKGGTMAGTINIKALSDGVLQRQKAERNPKRQAEQTEKGRNDWWNDLKQEWNDTILKELLSLGFSPDGIAKLKRSPWWSKALSIEINRQLKAIEFFMGNGWHFIYPDGSGMNPIQ